MDGVRLMQNRHVPSSSISTSLFNLYIATTLIHIDIPQCLAFFFLPSSKRAYDLNDFPNA